MPKSPKSKFPTPKSPRSKSPMPKVPRSKSPKLLNSYWLKKLCHIGYYGIGYFGIGCYDWQFCPDTHFLVFVHFESTSVHRLGYFQYQGFRKNTFRIPSKIQLSSVQ